MSDAVNGKFKGKQFASSEELAVWLGLSTGGSTSRCSDWEVDGDSFAAGVLGMLGAGLPVWLGTTRDGAAITVTTELGGEKQRVFVRDVIEWDEYWVARAKQADQARAVRERQRNEGNTPPPGPQEGQAQSGALGGRTARRNAAKGRTGQTVD